MNASSAANEAFSHPQFSPGDASFETIEKVIQLLQQLQSMPRPKQMEIISKMSDKTQDLLRELQMTAEANLIPTVKAQVGEGIERMRAHSREAVARTRGVFEQLGEKGKPILSSIYRSGKTVINILRRIAPYIIIPAGIAILAWNFIPGFASLVGSYLTALHSAEAAAGAAGSTGLAAGGEALTTAPIHPLANSLFLGGAMTPPVDPGLAKTFFK